MTINDHLLVKYTGRHFKNWPSINPIRLIENVKIVQFMFCKCCCFIILQGLISSCLILLVLPFLSSFAEPWLLVQIQVYVSGVTFGHSNCDVCYYRAFGWDKVRSNHVRIFLLKRNFDFLWFSVKLRFLISRMWTQITLKNDRKLYHCGLIALERHVKSWF